MSREHWWEKHLYVTIGRIWLEQAAPVGAYRVVVLALCSSQEREPFKVWFQLDQCPLEVSPPEQPEGFQVSPPPRCKRPTLTLRARPPEQTTTPPLGFLDFCLKLLDPSSGAEPSGYDFLAQLGIKVKKEPEGYSTLPIPILFGDPVWDAPRKGRVLQFAHLAKPFTLICDKSQYECTQCTSAAQFDGILEAQYEWPTHWL